MRSPSLTGKVNVSEETGRKKYYLPDRYLGDLEALHRTLNETALVSETDKDGYITYANEKFIEISKYRREELIGENHRILKSNFHSPQFYKNMWKTITSGKVWHGIIKNRAKDGSFYWVDTSIAPIPGEDGKPLKYISVRFPITEQMELQEKLKNLNTELEEKIRLRTEELQQSENGLRELTNSMPQLVWTATPKGEIDYCNEKYKEYEGIGKRGGRLIWEPAVHLEDRKRTIAAWKKAVKTGAVYEIEQRVLMKNGRYRWHLARAMPVTNKQGSITKWYGTTTDIHERKKTRTAKG